jgi:hypothetical protein
MLLNRDLLRVGFCDLRQRQLQHSVDMLGLRCIGIDCLGQADRTARLAESPFFPKRLAGRFGFIEEFCADGDTAIFDIDVDFVLGDARKLGPDDIRFRR